MRQKSERSEISWVGVLFGLLFLVGGLFGGYGAAKMVLGYFSSAGWERVPASVYEIKLDKTYGDTTTYTVKADYAYQFNSATYHNSRVSLSTGSDNFGSYWQDLERRLRRDKANNESFAYVNPKHPAESLLDRTLRWRSIVFGLVFITLFGGVGVCAIWISLKGKRSYDKRRQDARDNGIVSHEKSGSWLLAAFGAVFFILGSGISLMAIPEALRKGEYGALLILVFVLVGAGILIVAAKMGLAYRRFGETRLYLDPVAPGVGGELGGRFEITAKNIGQALGASDQFIARLLCTSKYKSGKNTRSSVRWQKETPVYLTQTASGVEAVFLFDIPDDCKPSKEWKDSSGIDWSVVVEGDFNHTDFGDFVRSWDVIVEATPAHASRMLSINESTALAAENKLEQKAETAALSQIPISEDSRTIRIVSSASREMGGKFLGLLFGVIFCGVGVFTIMDNWWPGYVFVLIGGLIAFASLFIMGKSIEVRIDKHSRVLRTQERWLGIPYAKREGKLLSSAQFELRNTSSTTGAKRVTKYYALNFVTNGKAIRIADTIKGEIEAEALKASIIDRCFGSETFASAA